MNKIFFLLFFCFSTMTNFAQLSTRPVTSGTNAITYNSALDSYEFACNGEIIYRYKVTNGSTYSTSGGTLHALQAKDGQGSWYYPSNVGGISAWLAGAERRPWTSGVSFSRTSNPYQIGAYLYTSWRMQYSNDYIDYYLNFFIQGRTLTIYVGENNGTAKTTKFDLDRSENTNGAKIVGVPYLTMLNIMYINNRFTSMFIDWEATNSSTLLPQNSQASSSSVYYAPISCYNAKTNGQRNSLKEIIYLTTSENLNDVLPNIPNPVSPYRNASANRMVWDYWEHEQNGFMSLSTDNRLNEISTAGISNLWLLIHCWQRFGYDNHLPVMVPLIGGTGYGDEAQLKSTVDAADSYGYLVGLHENYYNLSPDAGLDIYTYAAKDGNGNLKTTSVTGTPMPQPNPTIDYIVHRTII